MVSLSHFETGDTAKISFNFSNLNIQSRFIGKFEEAPHLIDTPDHTIQGFIVDMFCHPYLVFTRQDHSLLYKNNNLWLFIDDDDAPQSTADLIVRMNSVCNEI